MRYFGSYGNDGKISLEELNNNLNKNIPELTYQGQPISNDNKIESLPAIVVVDGYNVKIHENGNVTLEGEEQKSQLEKAKDAGTILSTTDNTPLTDKYGNQVILPPGFKIAEDSAIDVTGEVVIEDVSHEATKESQFVWIPVGKVYTDVDSTEDKAKTINLSRYVFNDDGSINKEFSRTNPSDQLKPNSTYIYYFTEGLKTSTTTNTHAKDIETFITKANSNHGYYIGRYEARTPSQRTSETDELKQVTVKKDDYVYNYVTQPQAASKSQEMYNEESKFTSDLVNSYAWDTAIVFLQTFDDRTNKAKPYSRQTTLNTSLAKQGTNKLEADKQDKICNIWDMASNVAEWSTESFSDSITPCSRRGDDYENSLYTSNRGNNGESISCNYCSFRVVVYL